jgi:hypothetical protein
MSTNLHFPQVGVILSYTYPDNWEEHKNLIEGTLCLIYRHGINENEFHGRITSWGNNQPYWDYVINVDGVELLGEL